MESVSVIIPVHNTRRVFLTPCLDSIAEQTIPINVIIVDDASRYETREFLEFYAHDKPNWKVIKHRRLRGVAVARNTGVKHVKTKYTAICDSDDVWHPTKLEHQIKTLEATGGDVNLCGVTIDYRNASNYPMAERQAPHDLLKGLLYESLSEFIIDNNNVRVPYTKLIRFNASLCGSNAVFNTNTLKATGCFNPKFNGADEWDALLNVANVGKVTITPLYLCQYVRHSGSFSVTKTKHLRSICEDIIYKHRKNLNDLERVLLQNVEVAQWATEFEKLTFAPNTPYKIIQYHG